MKKQWKKSAVSVLAAGMLLVPASPAAVLAAAPAASPGPAVTGQTVQATASSVAQQNVIRSLTLEEAIQRALEVDRNYKILQYTWRMLDEQQKLQRDTLSQIEDRLNEVEKNPPSGPSNTDWTNVINNILNQLDPATLDPNNLAQQISNVFAGLVGGMMQQSMAAMQGQQLEQTKQQLESAIEQLSRQKRLTRLQQDEAREGVKLLVTQMYVQLLTLKQQVLLVDKALEQQKQAVQHALLKYQLGLLSIELYDQELRKLQDAQRTADNVRNQYEQLLTQFLFMLDLPFVADFQLFPVTPSSETVPVFSNLEKLVANSFDVRKAKETLNQARDDLDDAEDEYDEFRDEYDETDFADEDEYDEALNRLRRNVRVAREQVAIAEEQLKQTEQTVRTRIENLFRQAADAQAAYHRAQQKWQEATADYQRMVTRYQLGVIARVDLENYSIVVQQASAELETSKNQYFIALEKLKALEAGYVSAQ